MNPVRALALLLLVPTAAVGAAPSLRYADGRLSGRVEQAELADVLAEVARQADLEIRGLSAEPEPVSVALDDVPLDEALGHLLAGRSFVLAYAGARPTRVTIFGRPDGSPLRVLHPTRPSPRRHTPRPPTRAANGSVDSEVPLRGRLARALGVERASFPQVMGAAVRSQDARVRVDALRLALRMLDAEPDVYASPLRMLAGMDDATLASWLTRIAGDDALRVLRWTARAARAEALRLRAVAVVRYLKSRGT
jgi:hypothetical protein